MNPISLFTSFRGRIGRRAFIAGMAALAAISPFSVSTLMSSDPFSAIQNFGQKGLFWMLILLVPLAALLTKRLHDRNKSGLLALLFYGPAAIAALQYYGIPIPGMESIVGWIKPFLAIEMGAVGLWFMYELGLKGPVDPNKYGPDPRA